ncbi:MAG: hypothetical protein ACFFCW_38635 [Candidatus Hodarchaeota archaeon]
MDQKYNPLDICIISHLAYGAMKGGNSGPAGSVEHQTILKQHDGWLHEVIT